MIAKDTNGGTVRQRAFRAAVSHVVAVSWQMRRRREKRARHNSLLQRFFTAHQADAAAVPAAEIAAPDPVRVAVLAIDGVGRASIRACFTGNEIHVAAPDEATASVLRSALAETGRTRATDRLIRIVVAS